MSLKKERTGKWEKIYRQNYVNGSFTVEMSLIMPIILFLIMGCILACFYYHDKNILAGAAYETAVTGSTKAREKDGISEGELNTLFKERVGKKCILFPGASAVISIEKDKIHVSAVSRRRHMILTVESSAAVIEPEKYIRDIRRIKK